MKKKFLSIFLALCMCLTLLPTTALAASPQTAPDGSTVAEVTRKVENTQVTEYVGADELALALANSNTVRIKLLQDAEISADVIEALNTTCEVDENDYDCIKIEESADVTLDLNGHRLRAAGWVNVLGELTLLDSGAGGIFAPEGLQVEFPQDSSILTLSGGTIDSDVLLDGGKMYVFGGKVAGTVSVRECEYPIPALSAVAHIGGRLTVTDGEIAALKIYAVNQDSPHNSTEEILLSGGKFGSIDYDVSDLDTSEQQYCTLLATLKQGAAFYDKNDELINVSQVWKLEDVRVGDHQCEFTNGACACGAWKNDDEPFGDPETAVAKVESSAGTRYENTIEDALGGYGTVTLLKDCTSTNTFWLGTNFTLDLNGKTLKIGHSQGISISDSLTVTDTSPGMTGKLLIGVLEIERLGSLTLKNGTIQVDESAFSNSQYQPESECTVSGTLTVNGGTFHFGEDTQMAVDGAMTVNGGTVMVDGNNGISLKNSVQVPYSLMSLGAEPEQDTTPAQESGDTMRINGGTIKTGIEVSVGKTLTVTGGNFPAPENNEYSVGVAVAGGTAKISGGTIAAFIVYEAPGSKAEVSGGTFGEVIYEPAPGSSKTALDLLNDGYAFAKKDDTTQIVQVLPNQMPVENVTVVAHEHSFTKAADGRDGYVCACGKWGRSQPISYIDAYGEEQTCTDYEEVNTANALADSWYVVKGKVTLNSLNILGDVHLILCDGATLTVNGSIEGLTDSGLVIYAQSADASRYGKLAVSGSFGMHSLIDLTVNGGEVKVDGGGAEKGIYVENLTVNAGKLTAKNGEIISVNTPIISAIYVDENLTVNGGEIEATGPSIGTHESPYAFSSQYYCSAIAVAKNMTVNGGKVTAVGGTIYTNSNNYGVNAGIALPINAGGNVNPKLTVNRGTVTAKRGAITASGTGDVISADIYSQNTGGKMTVNGGKVQQDAAGSAVKVLFDDLHAYGGTIKLAKHSEIGFIYTKSEASFGDLVADGCAYFKADGGNETWQLDGSDIQYTGREYCLGEAGYWIMIWEPLSNENPPVPYLDEKGQQKNCVLYTVLEGTEGDKTISQSGWYVVRAVSDNPAITGTLKIENGKEVHLILCDNTVLTVNGGVDGAERSSLHIYGQRAERDASHEIGKLIATDPASGSTRYGYGIHVNDLTINGGVIEASAPNAKYGYGIYVNNNLTINDGTVTATGGKTTVAENETTGYEYYGIYATNNITITGGTVTATGGTVQTVCGDVSWNESCGMRVELGNITVTGGTVTATGSTVRTIGTADSDDGAVGVSGGIDVGNSYLKSKLTVSGGTVTATGSDVSVTNDNIYSGSSYGIHIAGDIEVKNSTVTSTGGNVTVSGTNDSYSIWGISYGLYVTPIFTDYDLIYSNLKVPGGTLKTTSGDVTVNRTNAYSSDNDYCDSTALDISGAMTVSGGTVETAHGTTTLAESSSGSTYAYDLSIYELAVNGGTMKFKDSYLGNPVTVSNDVKLADLLAEGYAYWQEELDEEWNTVASGFLNLTDLTTALNGGRTYYHIKLCTHSATYGTCTYCGNDLGSAPSNSTGSGSSNPTVKTETTTAPDGSVTKTETKKDGTVVETTTTPNGSTSTTTTITNENGSTTTSNVTISSSAVNEATNTGGSVTLPVEVPAGKVGESTTTINVTVPAGSGSVTVDIPVSNVTPGTVVIIVNEDGTETIIPGSKVTKNGIQVTLNKNSTLKIVDASKSFSDVQENAYFAAAVQWAASRGITNGTSDTTFSPDNYCGRSQLITFLWRAAGQPKASGNVSFTDTDEDSYYAEALRWAASLGIIGGYGNGLFGPDDTITREQMAVILYRFAQNMGLDTVLDDVDLQDFAYYDYENISDYAVEAMTWAVSTGILQGYDNYLMPAQPCSRGQIVTMLYRLLG